MFYVRHVEAIKDRGEDQAGRRVVRDGKEQDGGRESCSCGSGD